MVIIRGSKPNHKLLFLGGALFLAHDTRVTMTATTPTVVASEDVWADIQTKFGPVIA